MNLPNKLTVMRILMVPAVVVLLLAFDGTWSDIAAAACYLIAAVTDFFDGKIARKYGLVTNFGKFMAREFAISGFRLIAVERGVVIAAGKSGKIKTTLQNIWCVGILIPVTAPWWKTLTLIVMILAVILTVYSFLEYLYNNQQVLKG